MGDRQTMMGDDKAIRGDYVTLYDSTLRDGAQTRGVDFNVEDKIRVAKLLDNFGIDYIEGGWPGSNPIDDDFFAKKLDLKRARISAFGMTRRAGVRADKDQGLSQIIASGVEDVCLVGKSWAFQVETALNITRQENIAMIGSSVGHMVNAGRQVFFDAEHFFDGFGQDPDYALDCIKAAIDAGARWVVLCDTNGGTLPSDIGSITSKIVKHIPGQKVGIHCHNDTDNATANSLAAVQAGARQVQGTFNGLGERCGNANLVAIIPNLILKMGLKTAISPTGLENLRKISVTMDDILNRSPQMQAPYVGLMAFSHKGGLHAAAVAKSPQCYEHIDPASVGNRRHILISVQAGRSNLVNRLRHMGIDVSDKDKINALLQMVKLRSYQGYTYDGAEASFELLARSTLQTLPIYFTVDGYRVVDERRISTDADLIISSKATINLRRNGQLLTTGAEGNGPVNALDKALRTALQESFPKLKGLKLVDYKVRILAPSTDTSALTRVMISCVDQNKRQWQTVGVSTNVIDASWMALHDAVTWKLFHDGAKAQDKA